jgi:hypothetical protein
VNERVSSSRRTTLFLAFVLACVLGGAGFIAFRQYRPAARVSSGRPDARLIAFKSRLPESGECRPHLLDLDSRAEWAIEGETRNIDDQVEWLDSEHVLYEFTDQRGLPEEAVNVWMSPVSRDGSKAPRRFIRAASSPAVVRP